MKGQDRKKKNDKETVTTKASIIETSATARRKPGEEYGDDEKNKSI